MTEFGAEILSDLDDTIVLSEETKELLYIGKGSGTVPVYTSPGYTGFAWAATWTSPVIPGGKIPIFFHSVPVGLYIKVQNIYAVGDGTWKIVYFSSNGVAPEFYFFVDSTGGADSSDAWGMWLYDANGNLTYDAGWKVARVKRMAYFSSVVETATATFASGLTKPAIMFRSPYAKVTGAGTIIFRFYFCGRSDSTTLSIPSNYSFAAYYIAGMSANYERTDGLSRYVPIIDAADYD